MTAPSLRPRWHPIARSRVRLCQHVSEDPDYPGRWLVDCDRPAEFTRVLDGGVKELACAEHSQ